MHPIKRIKSFISQHLGWGDTPGISDAEALDAQIEGISVSMLLGNGKTPARTRQQILAKWMEMVGDPIVSTALRLHVTSALGGNETSGDVVFIERNATLKDDPAKQKIVDEIRADLSSILNGAAYTVAFNASAFGDGYARVYSANKVGVTQLYVDALVHPAMVTPYERGNTTAGYVVANGPKLSSRLDVMQMARLKLPRMVYLPQTRAMESAVKLSLEENDPAKLPLLVAQVGGSFLDGAEGPYDKLSTALVGLIGQRVLDSIDETMLTVNMQDMTKDQRQEYMKNLRAILTASKQRAEAAVASGKPFLSRLTHILPVWGDKQLTAVSGSMSSGGARGSSGTISIDDVMFYAKLLCGAIGIDLSMLGFADLLGGGLGEGGFFRTSAQAAERARFLRVGLTEFFNHIIDIHTYHRYGIVFSPAERPWQIHFYGSISALEAEKQTTKTEAMNTGMLLAQALAGFKDLNLNKATMVEILTKILLLEEHQAEMIATSMSQAADAANDDGAGDPLEDERNEGERRAA